MHSLNYANKPDQIKQWQEAAKESLVVLSTLQGEKMTPEQALETKLIPGSWGSQMALDTMPPATRKIKHKVKKKKGGLPLYFKNKQNPAGPPHPTLFL